MRSGVVTTARAVAALAIVALLAWVPGVRIAHGCGASTIEVIPPAKPSKPAVKAKRPAAKPAKPAPVSIAAAPDTSGPPSFTGRWKLSLARSVFGDTPGGKPTSRTDVIEHTGTRIKQTLYLVLGSKPDTTVYLYSTDGTPTVNKVAKRDIRSVVTWEGRTLHLVSTAKLLVLDTSLDERWRLSPDGRELTYQRHVKYGFGEGDQSLVFEREGS